MTAGYVCTACGAKCAADTREPKCRCGGLFELDFTPPVWDPARIDRSEWSIFRYRDFMAVDGDVWRDVTMGEGMTPVIEMDGRNGVLLKSHEVIDPLIIMLGTNDVKERFGANAACIAAGLERLILKCKSVDCWGAKAPNILVVAPPRIKEGFHDPVMGEGCVERSAGVAEQFRVIAERQGVHFLDAEGCEFNRIDFMHLTRHGHAQLAEKLAELVPTLL